MKSLRDLQSKYDLHSHDLELCEKMVANNVTEYRKHPTTQNHDRITRAVKELHRLQGGRP